ncbi:hypothetical protein phiAS5_ORF0083 [Aeromonas phage phiAS5]|uniref:Uncharacterized protein n=1 Tax=Aeromonas phage phiAS5 TaxID=879630 RepID=E1A2I0_9CAUD|nr:hypothetical protein phiAS5_ORF0083 [Aeromonas phage phiAS5]ADM79926.1 hypothetical protein phiAS5_ORF0083 [Aeromonas phage phiAS5]BES53302.1 hypothetical protein [Aeromonas phage phiWae14]
MHEFMIKIGYTLISNKEEFTKFCEQYNFGRWLFMDRDYEEHEFPLYMKEVMTEDNGYGQGVLNFSTVKPELVK